MTETAPKPKQLSLGELQTLFEQSYPQLVEPFKLARPRLEDGTGQQDLANLIGCEVTLRQESGLHIYSWSGTKGNAHEMRVPKAFDPQPVRANEGQQQAQVQEPAATPELGVLDAATEPAEPALEPVQVEAPTVVARTQTSTGGMFSTLADLLGDATLLLTVARSGETKGKPLLIVTVVSDGEGGLSPICLEGSAAELDEHFVAALTSKVEAKAGLKAQIEALKAADKALEEAKKEEVAAKTKQAEAKKKSAQKKASEVKAGESKAAEEAEAKKQQTTMFD